MISVNPIYLSSDFQINFASSLEFWGKYWKSLIGGSIFFTGTDFEFNFM